MSGQAETDLLAINDQFVEFALNPNKEGLREDLEQFFLMIGAELPISEEKLRFLAKIAAEAGYTLQHQSGGDAPKGTTRRIPKFANAIREIESGDVFSLADPPRFIVHAFKQIHDQCYDEVEESWHFWSKVPSGTSTTM